MAYDIYHDFYRPSEIALMLKKGYSLERRAYEVTVLDARWKMQRRFFLTKRVLRLFRCVPAAQRFLDRCDTYEAHYIEAEKRKAAQKFLPTPEELQKHFQSDHIQQLHSSFDGSP